MINFGTSIISNIFSAIPVAYTIEVSVPPAAPRPIEKLIVYIMNDDKFPIVIWFSLTYLPPNHRTANIDPNENIFKNDLNIP